MILVLNSVTEFGLISSATLVSSVNDLPHTIFMCPYMIEHLLEYMC